MKTATVIMLALLSVVGASAQTHPIKQPPEHASVADQKMCYDQAVKYVRDQNGEKPNWYTFIAAHYDAGKRICYVRYIHVARASESPSDQVSDAFEGTSFASYVDGHCFIAGGDCEAENAEHFKIVLAKYFPWVFPKVR